MKEIRQSENVILFLDELHTLIGAGAAEGAIDASNMLKPALSRGEIQTIGATTLDEYRKYIEKDGALERRFQPIIVRAPSVTEAIEIIRGLRHKYEAHHRVKITDEAVNAAVKLADRYITERQLPDKAIDVIDEASSRTRLMALTPPPRAQGNGQGDRAGCPGKGHVPGSPGVREGRLPAREGEAPPEPRRRAQAGVGEAEGQGPVQRWGGGH